MQAYRKLTMLSRVHQRLGEASSPKCTADRRSLDELRTGANDRHNTGSAHSTS